MSSTAIFVTWEEVPSIDANGIITMYEVRYVPLQTFGGLLVTETVTTSSFLLNISQLEEYVEYNISVRAYTSVGPGPYSDGIINRTLEDSKKQLLCMLSFTYYIHTAVIIITLCHFSTIWVPTEYHCYYYQLQQDQCQLGDTSSHYQQWNHH